jgi:hypothetical protein
MVVYSEMANFDANSNANSATAALGYSADVDNA